MKVTNNISEIALFCIAVHYLAGALPLPFQKGERVVEVPFHNSFIISCLIKVDLKPIYCNYSRTQKIQSGFP